MKQCPRCGAFCNPTDIYCKNCGYRFPPQPNSQYNTAPVVDTRQYNPFAVASLVLGIVSILCMCCSIVSGILSVMAIIFGGVAISSITSNYKVEKGHSMAVAGIITGLVSLLLIVAIRIIALLGIWTASNFPFNWH